MRPICNSEASSLSPTTVVLIGNYPLDRQCSMLQFAQLLFESLKERGLRPILLQPRGYLGYGFKSCPRLRKYLGYIDKYLIFPMFLRAFVKKHKHTPLIFHILDHSNALYHPYLKGQPTLISCHDMIAIKAALGKTKAYRPGFLGRLLQNRILQSLRAIPTIVCLSEATQDAVASILKRPKGCLPIVYLSPTATYKPMEKKLAQAALQTDVLLSCLDRGYILHVGNGAWYKNREGLLYIYKALKDALGEACLALVCVGPRFHTNEQALIEQNQLEVFQVERVAKEKMNALYAAAQCLLLPSLEEGLGLPILEAMGAACLVVCTAKKPFTEIAGEAAVFIPELEDFSLQGKTAWAKASAERILELLKEPPALRQKRMASGLARAALFSKEKAIEGYLRVYASLASGCSSK